MEILSFYLGLLMQGKCTNYCSFLLLSAAEGQRPRNFLSCSWIFCLIYALSISTTMLPLDF